MRRGAPGKIGAPMSPNPRSSSLTVRLQWAAVLPVLLGLPLAGCLAPHSEEARPEVASLLGDQLPESWSATSASGAYGGPAFWNVLGVPELEGLVDEALAHNHDLAASASRVRSAMTRIRAARSVRRPQVNGNLNYARQKNVFVGLPIPGSDGPLSSTFDQWSASIDLSWEFDLWGKLGAGIEAASADFEATAADHQAARLSIAAGTARAWFQLREANDQLRLAQATLTTYQESLDVVRGRFDAGLSGALDLRLAEANVATSQAGLVSARRSVALAKRQIEVLLGRYPAGELSQAEGSVELPPVVPAGVPADVLRRRPDLVAAERRMAAAEASAAVARLDRLPNIALTSSLGRSSGEFDDLLDGDFTVWSIAGGLVGPIIDGGRRRARVAESLEDLRAARSAFAAAALQAFFEVENALDAETLLRERLGHLENAVNSAKAATELADEQYREGLVSIELVLESQRRQFAAESSFLSAQRELFQTRVDLHVALGGSFGVPEDEPAEARDEPAVETPR